MATWDDVRQVALALPEATERDRRGDLVWEVRGKAFAWERPLRRSDLAALGNSAPAGPVLAVRVADEGVKHALVAAEPGWCFTTPHFDGYAAVLLQLDHVPLDHLRELLAESWAARAPARLVRERGTELG
jgi:hypothetical protein